MQPNLILFLSLIFISVLLFISEVIKLKKEVRKLNKIVEYLLKEKNIE